MERLKNIDKDEILEALGLQAKPSGWGIVGSALSMFGIGLLVGVGLGLAFAPKAGTELRQDIVDRVRGRAGMEGERPGRVS